MPINVPAESQTKNMEIRKISVNRFKSLVDFEFAPQKFTCLIGLNGAGKSTTLQFIDFLGQQVRGDLEGWLEERRWQPKDIMSRLSSGLLSRRSIDFSVEFVCEDKQSARWKASLNPHRLYCTTEIIETPSGTFLEVQDGRLRIVEKTGPQEKGRDILHEEISFTYQGSILSQLREDKLPPSLVEFRDYVASVKSLDLLSPEYLRQRTRDATGSIGLGGQRLSAFLHELGAEGRRKLVHRLKEVYPHLESLDTKSLRSGWKQLEIQEWYGTKKLVTEARHINDGMLRLLAILAEIQTEKHRFLLFDEIENGINPELVEFVLGTIVSAQQQIMVTTHSPLILNYLDDAVAQASVIYVYKTDAGHTQAIPFFSIPSLKEKLTVMGPGEAFADTHLTQLDEEIARLTKENP